MSHIFGSAMTDSPERILSEILVSTLCGDTFTNRCQRLSTICHVRNVAFDGALNLLCWPSA
jgi:hypothetical protein